MQNITFRNIVRIQAITAVLFFPLIAEAGRPFATEDAGVAGKGIVQIEMSWDNLRWRTGDRENVFMIVPVIGISDAIELAFETPFMSHSHTDGPRHSGIGDVNVVTKILLADESEHFPAFAFKTVAKTTTARSSDDFGSGAVDYGLTAVMTKQIGGFTVHGMAGYTFIGKQGQAELRDVVHGGFAADYSVSELVHLVGEIVCCTNADKTINVHPVSAMTGTTVTISDLLTLDASTRFGLNAATPDWNTSLGLTVNL